ncbi:hypothetical protein H9L10_02200 [Phycicoccus endophyticus]|uniref:Exo-alpha-sialidase n=1 Tax=Phycicoccus endophyticus TaxID=1690220 RepID=A0A7G9R2U5_9MICO|nr:hypothetical protein [Phycicoccus endophyticus]NHI20391.1 hypothetical protein [Phycicoccus endophyticus]QNN49920.1 hypothetical protein H9L10_02200 [Phycicoccus endophyticus]GGL29591.1 hypothetical protein GCM10012283_09950 [Phycicoccus endophyticus]
MKPSGRARRALATAGLAAFVVLDLVLVVLAVRSTALSVPSGAASSPAPTSAAPATTPASPGPSTSEPTQAPAETAEPARRTVAAAGSESVWALDVGRCGQPGRVHVSTDGGASWASHDAPGAVTRVRPTGGAAAFAVGGDEECRFLLWNTADGGASWSDAGSAAAAWGRDPQNPGLLHRPGGDPVTPCDGADVVDLSGLRGGVGAVACGDGTLRSTLDNGDTWAVTLRLDGLAALSLTGPDEGVLAAVGGDCPGVRLVQLSTGTAREARCLEDARPAAGRMSVSVADDTVWVLAGDELLRGDSAEVAQATFEPVGGWPGR